MLLQYGGKFDRVQMRVLACIVRPNLVAGAEALLFDVQDGNDALAAELLGDPAR
ncbi:hypothetical protein D3C87_1231060 [compost metagenome]